MSNGYRVGNLTFPDTHEGRLRAQEHSRRTGQRIHGLTPRTPTPGQTPAQRQIEANRIKAAQAKNPPTRPPR